ncbi:MAG: GGDEF domain-containing protein [Coprococcus sp.]
MGIEGNHIFMLMDLDCFKQINDTFGHQYGDQVLKDVSQTLTKTFRHNDLIGKMGGDEFAIMILNVSDFSK